MSTTHWFAQVRAWQGRVLRHDRHGPRLVRLASLGLALVLIFLAAFSIWATTVTDDASTVVLDATQRNDVYQQIRDALSLEQSLEDKYHEHPEQPNAALRQQFDTAATALDQKLSNVDKLAASDAGDARSLRQIQQQVVADHDRYREVVDSSFALAEAGDPEGALDIHDQLAGAAFQKVTQLVADAASAERASAERSAASLHSLERMLVVVTPTAFALGLILLLVCWTVLVEYQRILRSQAAENASQARQLEESRERERQAEISLRHSQRLESVGQLAAGIAHEINTPVQFIGDNIRFLQGAFTDLLQLRKACNDIVIAQEDAQRTRAVATVHQMESDIDVEFVVEEVPSAIQQTLDGVERVATIVRAMKAFGYTSNEEKAPVDLNEAIANTLVVATSELKYVADVETDFGELPRVWCFVGDINQVVLNLVVNAAHAITAAGSVRGTITVRTAVDGDQVMISVRDSGTGIPPEVADRVFEPFFTTKEVGKGTGQGLSLCWSLVVDRHHGSISFETEPGRGTTFVVRLPIQPNGSPVPPSELAASSS
jgi:signal transduction histidine kinase